MPAPEDVNQRKFPVASDQVLYNDGDVSIAISVWKKNPAVGVRWNERHGDKPTGQGYPNYGKYPTWFILPTPVALATLNGLLTMDFAEKDVNRIQTAIKTLQSSK